MKNFKALLFVLVLAPVSVFATIVEDSNSSGNGHGSTSYAVNLDASQTIIAGQNEDTDYWFVDLEQAGTLNISFASTTLGLLNVGISGFTVTEEGNIGKSSIFAMDIDAGMHTYFVKGQPSTGFEGGEIGKIHIVSAVFSALNVSQEQAPAPAAWSMGTAMLGLLTVGRRNKAKS